MTTGIDATVGQISSAIARTIHDTFKREIKARLQVIANDVVEQTAEEIAKDLTLRVDHMVAGENGNAFGQEVRVYLRVGQDEKERQYVVEKSVKQV